MDSKFFDGLCHGDSANGVKLCMGVTGGDLWGRVGGCQVLYRGDDDNNVDFGRIVTVDDIDGQQITVSSIEEHLADSRYLYVLRRVNGCGDEERSLTAAVRVVFDALGKMEYAGCNNVSGVSAAIHEGSTCELLWCYCPLNQGDEPAHFNIYSDQGQGEIDFGTALASVDYAGAGFYSYEVSLPGAGRYLLSVRVIGKEGAEQDISKVIVVEVRQAEAGGIEILDAEAV